MGKLFGPTKVGVNEGDWILVFGHGPSLSFSVAKVKMSAGHFTVLRLGYG